MVKSDFLRIIRLFNLLNIELAPELDVDRTWENGIGQCLCLTGTVLRAQDHGSGGRVAKAGATASFVAVKRQIWNAAKTFFIDFTEPRDVTGLAIIPSALSMLASKSHRLKHTVWHTARGEWNDLKEESKTKICDLGWGIDRPPEYGWCRSTER